MDVQLFDFTRICRTCLSGDGDMELLFSEGVDDHKELKEICKMIAECTIYPVENDENLPNKICTKCVINAKIAYDFKTQCEKSYETLTSIIDSYRNDPKSSITSELVIVKEEQNFEGEFEAAQPIKSPEHKCQLCPKVFTQEVHLRKHISIVHWNNETICILCSKNCGSAGKLKRHIHTCHPAKEEEEAGNDPVKCENCNEEFDTANDLGEHNCTGSDPFDPGSVEVLMETNEIDETGREPTAEDTNFLNNDSDDDNDIAEKVENDDDYIPGSDKESDEEPPPDHEDEMPLSKLTAPKTRSKKSKAKSKAKIGKPPNKNESPGSKKENRCDDCGKIFTRSTHLRRHQLVHSGIKPYFCTECEKSFTRLDHLNKHKLNHATIKPHICSVCQRGFTRAEHLRRHMETRHGDKVANPPNPKTEFCSECGRGFTTAKYLQIHMKSHTDRKYICKFCQEEFRTKAELQTHSRTHAHERPFLCSECGLRFVRNDYLVIHMRRHKGEKPYKCKFCNKGFPRATDLNVHERYHTGEKTHLCTVCGKGFQRAYNLLVHMRVHTGERPYKCPHCEKSFAQGNDLKSHIRRHTGERFKCDICNEGFIQGYHLTQHKRNVHGIDMQSHIRRVEKFTTPGQQQQRLEAIEPKTGPEEPATSLVISENAGELIIAENQNFIKIETLPPEDGYQARIEGDSGGGASERKVVRQNERTESNGDGGDGDLEVLYTQLPSGEYVKCEQRFE